MAAEVSSSSLVRVLSGHIDEQSQIHAGNSDILITKDLLGSLSKAAATKDIDLEFKPGKLQTGTSPKSPISSGSGSTSASPTCSSFSDGNNKNRILNPFQDPKLQDLNFPPPTINFFEDSSLELKLQSNSTPGSSCYQSVCTLDKVKFALERAEKETMKKRSSSPPTSSSPSAATSSSNTPAGMFAAACPGCLLYVIASKTNPRCPRCNSHVPCAFAVKKPRIDLNASF